MNSVQYCTTITIPFDEPNTAGNALVGRFVSNSGEEPLVVDSNGNTWTTFSARRFFGKYWGIRVYSQNCARGSNEVIVSADGDVIRGRIAEFKLEEEKASAD